MSLRNSIKPTNRDATNIIINPSPATESVNYQPTVPAEPLSCQPNGGMSRRKFSLSKILRKICWFGLPIHSNRERSAKLLDIMPKPPRRKRVWCFQSRSETTADDGVWIAFEKKNQIKLNERFDNRSTDCDIRDKSIFGGEVTLKVMLGQSIGFIVDPESQQDVYQIECWPEMYWWQRLQYRLRSRKKIRNNPLYTHV